MDIFRFFLLLCYLVGQAAIAETCTERNTRVFNSLRANCQADSQCTISHQLVCAEIFTGPSPGDSYTWFKQRSVWCDGSDIDAIGYYTEVYDCFPPDVAKPKSSSGPTPLNPAQQCGSVVGIEDQSLGEEIPVVGTSFSLLYSSNFVKGNSKLYTGKIDLSGDTLDSAINAFTVLIEPTGLASSTLSFSNDTINRSVPLAWDGKDASGVEVQGYKFFASTVTANYGGYSYPKKSGVFLGGFRAQMLGLGGWAPSIFKYYDVNAKRLVEMNGRVRDVEAKAFAAGQVYVPSEDGRYVYIFDATTGRHLFTKTGLTGSNLYVFNYNSAGQISSIAEPFSRTTTFSYGRGSRLITIAAPKGQVTHLTSDGTNLLIVTNPHNETYAMGYYGTGGLLYTFQKPAGQISTFTYDSNGNLMRDAHSGGYFFDLVKNISAHTADTSVVSVMGRSKQVVSDMTSTSMDRNVVYPSGVSEQYQENINSGSTSKVTNSHGLNFAVQLVPDPRFSGLVKYPNYIYKYANPYVQNLNFNLQATLADPNDPFSITSMSYNSSISGVNTSQNTVYDPATKKFTTTSFLGRSSEATIDNYERLIATKFGNLETINLNYTNENLTSVVQASRTTTLAYNAAGLLQSVQDPLARTTQFTYDAAGRLQTQSVPGASTMTSYAYDANGNVTSVTTPASIAHGFSFNAQELLSAYSPPTLSGVSVVNTTYAYNLDKQLTQITRPDGQNVVFNYVPSSGVLNSYSTPEGTFVRLINTTNGLTSQITNPDGVRTNIDYLVDDMVGFHVFDASGNTKYNYVKSISAAPNHFVTSDSVSTSFGYSDVSYQNNDDGDLTMAGDLSLSYNTPNGQLIGTSIGSSVPLTDTYTYNSFGELTGYGASQGGGALYGMSLVRDANGLITTKSQTIGIITERSDFVYSAAGQLTQVNKFGMPISQYNYDANGNRISGFTGGSHAIAATYDGQDRLLTYNTLSFTYNANGDRTSKTNSALGTTTSYGYDVFGNLRQVTLPSADVITYGVDGLNRRYEKRVNGVVQRSWAYKDQYHIVAEMDATGQVTKRFVYGSKANTPDYMIMGGQNYRIITDNLGSPRRVINVANGSSATEMNFDEFGVVTQDTNPGLLPFGFAGGLYDSQTGLVRFGARDYDAETGRWTTKDPIRFGGGDTNLFGYVANDPVNGVDPNGLRSEILIYDFGHAVIRVDDPQSSSGSKYIDFYPTGTPDYPFSVRPGNVDINNSYPGEKRGSYSSCDSTPAQDRQIIDRAREMAKNPPNYQAIPLGNNQNCFSAAGTILGGCK